MVAPERLSKGVNMSDRGLSAMQAAEEDLRAAREQVQRASAILREALAEDERLANQSGGDRR
jgi:hypothetical protein